MLENKPPTKVIHKGMYCGSQVALPLMLNCSIQTANKFYGHYEITFHFCMISHYSNLEIS